MDGKQALYYAAIAIAVLIGVGIVVSVVSALVSLVWTIVSGVVSLAVLAGLVYVAYSALNVEYPTLNRPKMAAETV
ncbi:MULTISPECIES: hypothetical protein [Halorubrum]|uniref:Uncharacterized protein n=1 Tax=Halorubrum ezzemoulense TaxID=337243 RepID=A0A481RBZ3_HALEZ|nr:MULTISPECIES: hypothetical protein [Halorubrum]PHQ43729.1 hypothetical protein Z052_02630 [Halorubrum sp. C191]QAY18764.1 hypothetical protein EO776_01270 [Halorubrum ezzemoulense]